MISFKEILIPRQKLQDVSLFVLRFLPSYYMIVNHGWKKITNFLKDSIVSYQEKLVLVDMSFEKHWVYDRNNFLCVFNKSTILYGC